MPSDRPDKVEKWRYNVSQAKSITATAFAQMVLENGLRVIGPDSNGYKYCALETEDGFDVYRVPDVDWDKITVTTAATADPAAGADLADITVPANKVWKYIGGYCSLVNDANVANRYMTVSFRPDGTNPTGVLMNTGAMVASGTYYITEAALAANLSVGGREIIALGGNGIILPAGAKIVHAVLNLQAGDDISAFRYRYKEAPA